jgi:Glycosyl transferase family 2
MSSVGFDVVVPTAGRRSLVRLLEALGRAPGPLPGAVIVVSGRAGAARPAVPAPARLAPLVRVLDGWGDGPAAARNLGWRASRAEWVAFMDDDVVPRADWLERLCSDLSGLGPGVAGSQGRVEVPLSNGRRPTDWERNTKGLETARWVTADMAYRRRALVEVGGFDERFRRAYREDADLALRVRKAGYSLEPGTRVVVHPVRPAGFWVSVRAQEGNRDDALMRAVHGRAWRRDAGIPLGRRPCHLATTLVGATGLVAATLHRRGVAALGAAVWAAGVAELGWRRVAPGPRDRAEVTKMVVTSAVIPTAATLHWLAGWARVALGSWTRAGAPESPSSAVEPAAVAS